MNLDVEHALESLLAESEEELSESHSENEEDSKAENRRRGVIVVWDVAFDWLAGACHTRHITGSPCLLQILFKRRSSRDSNIPSLSPLYVVRNLPATSHRQIEVSRSHRLCDHLSRQRGQRWKIALFGISEKKDEVSSTFK